MLLALPAMPWASIASARPARETPVRLPLPLQIAGFKLKSACHAPRCLPPRKSALNSETWSFPLSRLTLAETRVAARLRSCRRSVVTCPDARTLVRNDGPACGLDSRTRYHGRSFELGLAHSLNRSEEHTSELQSR